MATCIGGFPHSAAVANVGGFLTAPALSGEGGQMDVLASGGNSSLQDPFGSGYIWVEDWHTAETFTWVGTRAPPDGGTSRVEFDLMPNYEAANRTNWMQAFAYRGAWLRMGGVEYALRVFVGLSGEAYGTAAIGLFPVYDNAYIEGLLETDFPGNVASPPILDAVAGGRALQTPAIMEQGGQYKFSLVVDRSGSGATVSLEVYLRDFYTGEITLHHTQPGFTLSGVEAWDGFQDMPWEGPVQYFRSLGTPRIVLPEGCPVAEPLPTPTVRVAELSVPSECSTEGGSPSVPYVGALLSTFRVQVPVGDWADNYRLLVESVCDKPMTVSAVEWDGWIFNNSRRI